MAILKSEKLTRAFLYDKDGEEVKLVDFNPQSTPEEIVKFYSGQYPELTNAKISPEFDGNNVTYNISTSVGTKG